MKIEQLNQLENIESQLMTLLVSLPKNDIARNLSSAKKSVHAAICQVLEQ